MMPDNYDRRLKEREPEEKKPPKKKENEEWLGEGKDQ